MSAIKKEKVILKPVNISSKSSDQQISSSPIERPITTVPSVFQISITQKELDDTSSFEKNQENQSPKTGQSIIKKMFYVFIHLLVFAIGIIIERFFFSAKQIPENSKTIQINPKMNIVKTITPQISTPTPTDKPFKQSDYSIKILNGSEIFGAALDLKKLLVTKEYNISTIENATNSSFLKTIVSAKQNVSQSFIKTLKQILSNQYVTLNENQILDNSRENDVEIIIGNETL
jgi:hypothetical protein